MLQSISHSYLDEVAAWRAEFEARRELNAPIADEHWRAVALTPEPPSDDDLRRARAEMLQMAGYRYLVWLLPLRANRLTRLVERLQAVMTRRRGCA